MEQVGRPQRDHEHRGEPPRVPAPTRELERAEQQRQTELRDREHMEQRSMLRGLIWLGVAALLLSMARAGWDRVFPQGLRW